MSLSGILRKMGGIEVIKKIQLGQLFCKNSLYL